MAKSSHDSPATSSPRPERPSGFFIPDFAEGIFGAVRAVPRHLDAARPWTRLAVASEALRATIRREFSEGGRVLHVCLQDALLPERAEALHAALRQALFRRHHHGPYPLHVAPLDSRQPPSTLIDFCAWLRSDEAAAFFADLVGWPRPLQTRQVQVSRMEVGESFPPHHDTQEEGLAVVFNFTRPWDERFGGVLAFPHPKGAWDSIRVPPLFNSVFVFRAVGALHRVTEWLPAAQGHQRYSITAFMLERP
ncbi:2OG-Fe(II) oxygenase [Myxococcus virescens]|uniref:2OG-Fe(II) oxygenase n=1 Tax=Myxococcus virescens TaxID=83456 RepID=UPI003DA69EAC